MRLKYSQRILSAEFHVTKHLELKIISQTFWNYWFGQVVMENSGGHLHKHVKLVNTSFSSVIGSEN